MYLLVDYTMRLLETNPKRFDQCFAHRVRIRTFSDSKFGRKSLSLSLGKREQVAEENRGVRIESISSE